MAQSRRKQLEKLEITEKPKTVGYNLKFQFEYDIEPYEDVLTTKNLQVEAGGKLLVENLNLEVRRGERLIIAGPNGAGKSTLFKVLCGRLRPKSGGVQLGSGVKASWFEQQQSKRSGRVIDDIWDKWPRMTELEARSLLAKFNFKGEDVYKNVNELSGGELSRLRFAEILLERPNLLLLDEPTNHLDIYTRESLGSALNAYEGTMLMITHDRYLMQSLNCPILYLDGSKTTIYQDFNELSKRATNSEQAEKAKPEKSSMNNKEERRIKAEVRSRYKTLEQNIEALGTIIAELQASLGTDEISTDHVKLQEVCDELEMKKSEQDEKYLEWEELIEKYGEYIL